MKKAYSYIRFSTEIQLKGDSLRRQLETTRAYCLEKGLDLQDVSYKDLGISGYTGDNLEGALGEFITACEKRVIKEGDALVVEAFDRLTRLNVNQAVFLFLKILRYGIEIHMTAKGKVFYPQDTNPNQALDLMEVIMEAQRANAESARKSDLVLKAHAAKRRKAIKGEDIVATSVPWFLKVEGKKDVDLRVVAPEERVEIVKRIFREYLAGKSCVTIARELENENIPTFLKRAKKWSSNRIKFLIEGDQVLGTLRESNHSKAKYTIDNYYPKIMDEETVYKARELLHLKARRGKDSKTGFLGNLFRGLISYEGLFLRFSQKIQCRKLCYYYGAFDLLNNKQTFFTRGLDLEHILIQAIFFAQSEKGYNPMATPIDDTPFVLLQRKKSVIDERIKNIVNAIAAGIEIDEIKTELTNLKADLNIVEDQLKKTTPLTSFEFPKDVEVFFKMDHFNIEQRERISIEIKKIVSKIELYKDIHKLLDVAKQLDPEFEKRDIHFIKYPAEVKKMFHCVIHYKNGMSRICYTLPKHNRINFIDVKSTII